MTFTEAVGALIAELRGNLSQAELATASGVAQSTISAIEKGNRTFRGVHIEQILRATNTEGVAAARMLRVVAERLQSTPAPTRKRRDKTVAVISQARRISTAPAKGQSKSSSADADAAIPPKSKRVRTPR